MNFDKLNKLLSLIANFAVVVGIIFLAVEMRTNTSSVRGAAYQTWVSVNSDLNAIDDNLSDTLANGLADSANLTEKTYMQFAMWHYTAIQMAQSTDNLYKMGAIDRDLWEREINRIAGHLDLPGVRQWWDAGARTQFDPEFVDLLESTESDIVRWSWESGKGFVPEDPKILKAGGTE